MEGIGRKEVTMSRNRRIRFENTIISIIALASLALLILSFLPSPARIREGAGFTGNGKDGPEGIFHCAPGRVPSADEAQKGWNGVLRSLSYA